MASTDTRDGRRDRAAAGWGVIFDWDGVIVDSSAQHEESWRRLAREEGRTLPDGHFKRGFGMKNEFIIPRLLAWTDDPAEVRRLSLRKEAIYREVIRETGLQALPGAQPLLAQLAGLGVPCAVGSSTPRLNITCVLPLLGLEGAFRAIVSAEDVTRGKPDPQVFVLAAQALGLPADCCVVFEDTRVGVDAARAAWMKTVAVATTHPPEALAAADRVVARLDELPAEALGRWVYRNHP